MRPEPPMWSFSEIATGEPARAALLETAPAPDVIAASIIARFEGALAIGQVRIGMEESDSNPNEHRVVLQFLVGERLSDQFFNSNTGYRAQFRRDWRTGLSYDSSIILGLISKVAELFPPMVLARRLSPKFEDVGAIEVSRGQVRDSLAPVLSKVWFCGRLITGDGRVVQLPSGVTGPRLRLDDQTTWAAISREEKDSWLDVKGAFVGIDGPYQPKDPIGRAKKLQASGEA